MTEPIEIFRKFFAEGELEELLEKAFETLRKYTEMIENPEKNSFNQAYRMAAFYSLDIAHIYDLMENEKNAHDYYETALDFLNRADFQPLWIRLECLRALERHEEALKTALDHPSSSREKIAQLYRKTGREETAQQLYAELALEESCNPEEMKASLYPQCLQHVSDLWEKAHDAENAEEYNQRARKAWEKVQNNTERNLYPIEEGWLSEGVGHIYEKNGEFHIAMEYYNRANTKYELANQKEYLASSETHQVDGDWGYYFAKYFYTQLPEILMIDFLIEYFMKLHLRRIKYRILMLEEKMRG